MLNVFIHIVRLSWR